MLSVNVWTIALFLTIVSRVFAASLVSHATVTEGSVVATTCAFRIVGGVVSGPPAGGAGEGGPGGGGLGGPGGGGDGGGSGPAGVVKSPVALPSFPHTSFALRTYEYAVSGVVVRVTEQGESPCPQVVYELL